MSWHPVTMTAFQDQLPALVGVVVGTLGTLFATNLADRARWSRDQSVRWDVRRLDAYAEYARATKVLQSTAARVTAGRRPGAQHLPLDRRVGEEMLAEAEAMRSEAWEAVLMLGDAATVEAGSQWRNEVRKLDLLARSDAEELTEWESTKGFADDARDRFYAAARQSLGVPGRVLRSSQRRIGKAEM